MKPHLKNHDQPRLAVIGGGSSGLISLKNAIEQLPGWEIKCFEKSGSITGCWGNPYAGFISTSTKYTTQFACMPTFENTVKNDAGKSYDEFFKENEYGLYLEQFAESFKLRPHIHLNSTVLKLEKDTQKSGWNLLICDHSNNKSVEYKEYFDQVIIATGLTASAKKLKCSTPTLSASDINAPGGIESINNKKIVVIGGGESAVDYAERLSKHELNNKVFLSLNSGIRVSPRYHPIRGVPSDFLRNRLMLSIHPGLRNIIGEKFVRARIRYQEAFEVIFPQSGQNPKEERPNDGNRSKLRKYWAAKLTQTAKDDLFNMFHNKSDTFLDAVAEQRIKIIGPPIDEKHEQFQAFNNEGPIKNITPDLIIPAIGYKSKLSEISDGVVELKDFYLGCTHTKHTSLHIVGYARPIIGNIPSISEIQAKYICRVIAQKISLPENLAEIHLQHTEKRTQRYQNLNLEFVYPVEMFPYCDLLAKKMKCFPSFSIRNFRSWLKKQLAPASTIHYDSTNLTKERIYMPPLLILLLLMIVPIDLIWRTFCTDKNQKHIW